MPVQTNGQKINQLADLVSKLAYFVSQMCENENGRQDLPLFPKKDIAKATENIGKKAEALIEEFHL